MRHLIYFYQFLCLNIFIQNTALQNIRKRWYTLNEHKMLEERQRLVEKIKSIDLEIEQLPRQNFYCTRNEKYFKWYESDGGISRYIPKKNRRYAELLAKKKYLSLLRNDILQEIEAIDSFLKYQNSKQDLAQKLLEDEAYAELLTSYVCPVSEELLNWMDSPYESNPRFPEKLVYRTKSDSYVRSKSEAIIASALFSKNIPYHYEELLVLGEDSFYPDFTIKHPITGKILYWEHFGMMEKSEYARKTFSKLQNYASYGIVLGINLIATFETIEQPLDILQVERMIESYFGM